MADHKIPAEWLWLKFTEILDVQGGTQPPKSQFVDRAREGYIRLLQIRDFGKKPVPTFIPDTSKLKKCTKDDLLIGRYGASLGRICTGMEGAYNVALAKVICPPPLNRGFLHGYLDSEHFQGELRLLSRSAQNGFNKGDLETIDFLLPPLTEQKVIADKLDTLLAQVENTKARLERIPQILKRFRQSVLAVAVSGRLTEEWRGTNDLTGWDNISLGGLVQNIEAGKNLKCIETPPGENEFGIIKISAVTWGTYDEEQSKTLPEKNLFLESRRIKVGDFLISRANTIDLLGNPVIVQKVTKNLMLSDKVLRLNMDDDDKAWVNIFLRSMNGRKEIQDRSTGNQMSMRNIGQKALLEIPIPKPPCEEQTEIVRRVDQLFAHADRIEQQVNNSLARVNNLTQSILAKAFRGELTEQWRKDNPELISGENSAEALLERIRAERAVVAKPKLLKSKA